MIHVIASISVKKGCLAEFIEVFKANVPNVLREQGCVEYVPTIDVATGLPPQALPTHWQQAGVADRIDLRIAPAIDTLRALPAEPSRRRGSAGPAIARAS